MSKWRKKSRCLAVTGHGDMRNARIVCNCGCGTQVLINIMRDSAFPMVEINVREHGAKRWRGAMVSGSDALTIASLIIDNVQQESKA